MHKGKKITLLPLTLAEIVQADKERAASLNDTNSENQQVAKSLYPPKKDKEIKLKGDVMLARKCDLAEISNDDDVCYALVCTQTLFSVDNIASSIPLVATNLVQEYEDIFPSEIPPGLPPMRGIEHQIDLIHGATLPNHAAYRTNPRRLRKFSDFWTAGIYVKALVLVPFLFFWFLRKMVLGVCVLIVELSIILIFGIVILFLR
jgi:hypothetical protein